MQGPISSGGNASPYNEASGGTGSASPWLQYQLGQQQLKQQQGQFEDVYNPLSAAFAANTNFGGAPTTPQPGVSTGPIWTPQQTQAMVNQSNAQGIQGAQTQQRAAANTMAGQGFGSQSPALQQIQQNAMSQAIAGNASNANNLIYGAAQGNAQQVLAEQTQAQNAWYQQQQQQIARNQLNEQYQQSLAGAMAGLV